MSSSTESVYEALDATEKAAFTRKTYAVLGIAAGCGKDAIKKAYKKASLQYHPDKNRGKDTAGVANAEVMFLKIKEAYEILDDDEKRAGLDAAVAYQDKARRAHADRMDKMDFGRRKMREELERREAAARGEPAAKRAKPSPPTNETAEQRARRENTSRAEAQQEAAAAAREAARRRAAKETQKRRQESRDEQTERIARSLKVRFKSAPGGPTPTDDDVRAVFDACGRISDIARGESGKHATLVFASAEAACAAAINEDVARHFKEVKLVSGDSWERVQAAISRRSADDLAAAPAMGPRSALSDMEKMLQRAELEAQIREAEGISDDGGGDDDDDHAAATTTVAGPRNRPPPKSTLDPEARADHRARLRMTLDRNLAAAKNENDADATAFAQLEHRILSMLLQAAEERVPLVGASA